MQANKKGADRLTKPYSTAIITRSQRKLHLISKLAQKGISFARSPTQTFMTYLTYK